MRYSQFFWLNYDILFSTVVRAVVLAKLVIEGICTLASFISALRVVLVAKLAMSGTLPSIFLILTHIQSF